jgi:peptidyl-prolyl cis-trans isomerase A (cyclophilin A)
MPIRLLPLCVAVLLPSLAAPAAAQEAPPPVPPAVVTQAPAPVPAPVPATIPVIIETPLGAIGLALETERAPKTSANFLRYVREKRYDGTSFYRALKVTPDGSYGLIQGGLKGDPKRALPPIPHESTRQTGLSHGDGAISMARGAPGSAQGDFFLIIGGLPALDAQAPGAGDPEGYAVFGRITSGMDVVKKILAAPTDPSAGAGAMKGQMIADPVPITRIVLPR